MSSMHQPATVAPDPNLHPVGSGFRSIIRSLITAEPGGDQPPERLVVIDDVAMLGIKSKPVNGVTLYFGRTDIPAIYKRLWADAEAAGVVPYEVEVKVDVTRNKLAPMLSDELLREDSERSPAERTQHVINLPRATGGADAFLRGLVAEEIATLERSDPEIADWRLSKVVSRYPHLLDCLAAHRYLSHVIMFVWEADVPGPVEIGGLIERSKLATLYKPERVQEMRTIGAEFLRAVLPDLQHDNSLDSAPSPGRSDPGVRIA